jgi:hypothetical protein
MKNKKHVCLEVEHHKEMKSFKGDVARLTSPLEQALRMRFVEAPVTQTTVTLHQSTMTPFPQ